jgi:hypothetical protein
MCVIVIASVKIFSIMVWVEFENQIYLDLKFILKDSLTFIHFSEEICQFKYADINAFKIFSGL